MEHENHRRVRHFRNEDTDCLHAKKKRRYALHSKHEKTGEALMYLIFRTRSIKRDNDPWPVLLSGRGLAFTRKGERVEGSVPGQ